MKLSFGTSLRSRLSKVVALLLILQFFSPIQGAVNAAGTKPASVTATQNATTGLITVSWTASTDAAKVGYKVVIDSSGSGKLLQVPIHSLATSFQTCYPFTGNTNVYVATMTSADLNPTYTAASPETYWTSYLKRGGFAASGTTCTGGALYTYTLGYNANGGTGTMDTQTGTASLVTVSANAYTAPTGKNFAGWCTVAMAVDATCSGTKYAAGANIILSSTITQTLYALWKSSTGSLTVGYNAYVTDSTTVTNLPTDSGQYATGDSVTVSADNPSRSGYTFAGWYDTSTVPATGTLYAAGTANDIYTMGTSNLGFYASWTANKYRFNPNTGTGSASDLTYAGSALTAITNTFGAPSGYEFDGWCTSALAAGTTTCNSGDTKYLESASLPNPEAPIVNLYAIWKSTATTPPAPVYVPTPPTITGISAPEVCAIDPQIEITGTYLSNATVTIDGDAVRILTASFSKIKVALPSAAVGVKTIVVKNNDGQATTTLLYKFSDTPVYVNTVYPSTYKDLEFKYTFTATDAASYAISGTLPAGLTLNTKTGEISGTPTKEGEYVFTIVASNICDDAAINVYMFVDKPIPAAFTCSVGFAVVGSDLISAARLAQLNTCLSKVSTVSPKTIDSVFFLSGGLPAGLTTDQALTHPRYLPIINEIQTLQKDAQIYLGAFSGTADSVQVNVYWPQP